MKKFLIFSVFGVLLGGVALYAQQAADEKYESPDYVVVKSDGAFEIRDYPAMTVVSAPMPNPGDNRNTAFMSLFGYISGKNEASQKISMTSPVITGDVDGKKAMSFVVPADVAKAGAPEASDSKIVVSKRSAGRFAVYRYSGRWTEANETTAQNKLSAWLKDQGLAAKGSFETANYDPPFTLPAFRRNETMLRINK